METSSWKLFNFVWNMNLTHAKKEICPLPIKVNEQGFITEAQGSRVQNGLKSKHDHSVISFRHDENINGKCFLQLQGHVQQVTYVKSSVAMAQAMLSQLISFLRTRQSYSTDANRTPDHYRICAISLSGCHNGSVYNTNVCSDFHHGHMHVN